MVTVTTRAVKGSALTHTELDANFSDLAEAANNLSGLIVPADYGATGNSTADDTAELNAMFDAARDTRNADWQYRTAFMSLQGKAYYTTGPLDLTKFRSAIGNKLSDGIIKFDFAGGIVLDMTGSSSVILDNVHLQGRGSALAPEYGIVMQRYATSGGTKPSAPWHRFYSVIVEGEFSKAGIMNYGSEDFAGHGVRITNTSRNESAYCLIIQRNDNLFAEASTFIDAPEGTATGAVSNIRREFTNLRMGRVRDTLWTVTAISAAATAVVSYTKGTGAIDPVNGDEITLATITQTGGVAGAWAAALDDRIYTVANVNTGTGTFELLASDGVTPVDTSALAGTYDSGSAACFYRTGPGVLINGSSFDSFDYAYVSTWGSHGFVLARGGSDIRGLRMHGHVEGDAIQSWMRFACGTSTLTVSDLDIYEHACHVHEDFFSTDASGAGKVELYSPKIKVGSWRTGSDTGEASGLMRGLMFDDPSKYYIYNAEIDIEQKAYMNPIEDFAYFSGKVHYRDTNETVFYGEEDRPDRVVLEDDFVGFAFDTFKWQSLGGTHGSSAVEIATSSANSGWLRLTSGADAAGDLAANGRQLNSRAIFKVDTGRTVVEFRSSMSGIANVASFIGLTDQDTALEIPCTMGAADAITSFADDYVGILFDTAADTDKIWCVSRKAAGTPQAYNTALDPVTAAATYTVWRLEINEDGDTAFYRNGVLLTTLTAAILPTRLMAFISCHFSRAATSRDVRLDRVRVSTGRHY